MLEPSNAPVSGPFLLACAAFVGASLLGGQVVGSRMIDKSGWHVTCPEGIAAAARPVRPPSQVIPERRCSDVATYLGPFAFDAAQLCRQFNDPDFNAYERRAEEAARAQQERLDQARLERAAQSADSQCACAAQVYRSDNLVALGVYAGSARQISLPGVQDVETGLRQALGTAQCQAIGGAL